MTDAQAAQIKELRMNGMGYRTIAEAVELSRDIVRNYCKANGMGGYVAATVKNMQERIEAGPYVSAVGKKSPSRKAAGRGSSARTDAGGSGGKHTRRQGTGKPFTQKCAHTAAGVLIPMGITAGSIAAIHAISGTGFGGAKMQFRKIKIADLVPASYNPRKKLKPGDKEYEKIKNSITEFGYVEPVIVNSDMTIIGGHQRVTVLSDLGYEEIDCIVIDIEKDKEKALNIALNKITGEWNKELLADLIKDLQDSDFDVAFTGFEPPEIEQLFNSVHDKKITEDDFDVEAELQKPAVAKAGDVWLLGRHRLAVGDSTLSETYDLLMAGQKANLVVTDPPYNVDYEGIAGKIQNDRMEDEKFYNFLFAAFVNMEQHMEQDASIYVFHADTEGLNFRKAFHAAGFYLSGCCIWKKQSLVLGRSPYQWQHEPVLFGWKKGGKHNWYSDRKQTTIWEFDRPKQSKDHPTMKPVGLVAYPIQNSCMSNCIVLDPFGGSGSTLIACEQTNRICYMAELDEKFVDVIVNRFIEQSGSAENVSVIRDGVEMKYRELVPEDVE